MSRKFVSLALLCSMTALAACSSDDNDSTPGLDAGNDAPKQDAGMVDGDASSTCGLVAGDTYDSPNFATNAAMELDIRARFSAFLQPMKDAEADLAVVPTESELKGLLEAGTPSLRSLMTQYYSGRVDGWIADFVAAAGNTWTPSEPPTGPGGKYGSNIFTARGTDIRQAIEKGMFAAALYHHAYTLTKGEVTEATLDRLIAIYGAHPSFPGNDKSGDGGVENPDTLIAGYAKRRDKRDPNNPGPYLKIKNAMITAKAAIAKGAECNAERDAALATFRAEWEHAIFGTVVYYLNNAIQKLSLASPTETDLVSALHGYGEAVGFVHGYRQLPTDARVVTDAQIDDLLTTMGAPAEGEVTSYKLVTDSATALPKLQQTIDKIAAIQGFTPQQLEDFKTNY